MNEPRRRVRFGRFDKLLLQHLVVAVIAVLALADTRPRPPWFAALGLALGFGSLAVRLMFARVLETSWPAQQDLQVSFRSTRVDDKRTRFLATWIQQSSRETRAGDGSYTFVQQVRPLLYGLTRDRLLHRHGIDPDLDRERARQRTGGELWALLTDSEKRTASVREIELAVQTIEKL